MLGLGFVRVGISEEEEEVVVFTGGVVLASPLALLASGLGGLGLLLLLAFPLAFLLFETNIYRQNDRTDCGIMSWFS